MSPSCSLGMSSPDKSYGVTVYLLDSVDASAVCWMQPPEQNPLESVNNMQAETMNVIFRATRCSNDPPRASHWGKLVLLLILLQGKAFRAAFLCFPLLLFLHPFGPLTAAASCFHHSEQELQILVELENRLETLLSGGWKRNVSDGAVAQEAREIFCNCVR